jgi:hypothetical protein
VTSEEGRGTTFRIELPQRQAAGSVSSPEADTETKTSPQTLAAASD